MCSTLGFGSQANACSVLFCSVYYISDVKIPFPTERHAQIAYDVLRIDPEPNRSAVSKQLQLESNHVIAYAKSTDIMILVHTHALHSNHILILISFMQIVFGRPSQADSRRCERISRGHHFMHRDYATIWTTVCQIRLWIAYNWTSHSH